MPKLVPLWVDTQEYLLVASQELPSLRLNFQFVPRALRSSLLRALVSDRWRLASLRALWDDVFDRGRAVFPDGDDALVARIERELLDQKGALTLVRVIRDQAAFTTTTSDDDDDDTTVETPSPDLQLISVDPHFAPGRESLEIVYTIRHYQESDTVTLEITSPHHGGPLYKVELHGADKSSGVHSFLWNGKSNATGAMADRFIHPLLAPFKVKLTGSLGHSGQQDFTVLYAGVRLAMGPWVPRDDRPQAADRRTHFVQLRLNELGYHGGPVTGALDDAAKSAIKRYKRYHTQLYTDTTDAITDALVARLEAGDNVRNAFDNTRFITKDDATSKVFTDADQYYRQYADLVSPVVKVNHEKDSLGRPVFPLKAEVLLLSKYKELGDEGAGVWSPEATGPVRVRWSTEDPSEDTTILPDGTGAGVPSRTKQYIDLALAVVPAPGDNTAEKFSGLRTQGAIDHRKYFFNDTGLLSYAVEDDGGNKAWITRAHVDPSLRKDLLGSAVILARTSYMAGDDYRFAVDLDFQGEANKGYLDGIYAGKEPLLHKRTGVLRVWRKARIGAHVRWGSRDETGEALSWAAVAARFHEAYIEYLGPLRSLVRDDFLTLSQYNGIVAANCTNATYVAAVQAEATSVANGNAAALNLGRYCVDFRSARLPGESVAAYGTRLGNTMAAIWGEISQQVVNQLGARLRPNSPQGLLVLDYKVICPTQWRAAGGVGDVPAGRSAWADKDGITMIEIDLPMDQDTLMAHEIGHNLYLSHWEVPAADFYRRPIDHDQNDHNCMMSYAWNITSRPTLAANGWLFLGRFCGKCNLKLRGWDLTPAELPAQS
ncbi:MAG: peptidoglycan-binding domain-containing protein [Polyangiales bacterium]